MIRIGRHFHAQYMQGSLTYPNEYSAQLSFPRKRESSPGGRAREELSYMTDLIE